MASNNSVYYTYDNGLCVDRKDFKICLKKDLVLWYCQAQVPVLFPITFDQLPIAKAIQYECDQINWNLSLSLNCSSYEDVYYNDVSFNDTFLDPEPHMANIGLALSLYLACLATVFGNTLVIIAVTKVPFSK